LAVILVSFVEGLSQSQFASIQTHVRSIEPPVTDVTGQGDFFGGLVRLAFHDAGTYVAATNSYGPVGCLNYSEPGNGGLHPVENMLEPVYQQVKSLVSRADFWVIAAYTAVQDAGGPMMPFKSGRVDCTSATFFKPAGLLPSPEGDWTSVSATFVTRMGLTIQDTVALMGAHVLGRAQLQNSGYEFAWVTAPNKFTNAFFRDLMTQQWAVVYNAQNKTYQWDRSVSSQLTVMMLNTDMALRFSNPNTMGCNDTTSTACMNNSVTDALLMQYANSQTQWFQDFTTAYTKLTSLGYSNLSSLTSAGSRASAGSVVLVAILVLALSVKD